MMKIRKNILFCIIVIFVSLFVVLLDTKTYMINTFNGKTIYVEDLKEGDFIENGAILDVTANYHFNSLATYTANLCFSEIDDLICDSTDLRIRGASDYVVSSYDDVFGNGNSYDGWVFKGVVYCDLSYPTRGYYLMFVPASVFSNNNQIPSIENKYEFESKCVSDGDVTYNWYKSSDITDYSISSNTDENIELKYSDGVFLLDRTNVNEDNEIVITFEFEASEGDIVSFESRGTSSVNGTFGYSPNEGMAKVVFLNGVKVLSLEDYFFFNASEIKIVDSGKQKLQFVLEDRKLLSSFHLSFYIKNLQLLTPVNTGSKLDYTKVSLGDKIYYTSTCSDGYVLSGNVSYDKEIAVEKKDDDSIDDKEENVGNDEDNPNTIDIVFIVFVLLFVSWMILFSLHKKSVSKYN